MTHDIPQPEIVSVAEEFMITHKVNGNQTLEVLCRFTKDGVSVFERSGSEPFQIQNLKGDKLEHLAELLKEAARMYKEAYGKQKTD